MPRNYIHINPQGQNGDYQEHTLQTQYGNLLVILADGNITIPGFLLAEKFSQNSAGLPVSKVNPVQTERKHEIGILISGYLKNICPKNDREIQNYRIAWW